MGAAARGRVRGGTARHVQRRHVCAPERLVHVAEPAERGGRVRRVDQGDFDDAGWASRAGPHRRGGAHVLCQRPDRQGSHQRNQPRGYPARRLQDGGGVQVVDARPKQADVGLPQARLGDSRPAGRHARRARARERLHRGGPQHGALPLRRGDVGARLQLRERDDVRRLENLLLRILVDAQFVDAVAGEEAMNSRRWARGPKPRPPREVCALPWIFGGALHLGATREKYHKELKEHH
mmetsp:Transcript_49466/g.159941  ORF Transcript_49466/g.159941 Transcript_49466/m.159941 type:complete len:237 (+) Transcript_49466:403-1113(+)